MELLRIFCYKFHANDCWSISNFDRIDGTAPVDGRHLASLHRRHDGHNIASEQLLAPLGVVQADGHEQMRIPGAQRRIAGIELRQQIAERHSLWQLHAQARRRHQITQPGKELDLDFQVSFPTACQAEIAVSTAAIFARPARITSSLKTPIHGKLR
jgi:hypothetical protein